MTEPAAIDFRDIDALRAALSPEFTAWSNAIEVTQAMIDEFSRLSGDDYWIHIDPERARTEGPFGGTIAHGMLIQSIGSRLAMAMPFEVTGFSNMVNYGSDRLRFPSPVLAGSRIHGRCRYKAVKAVGAGTLMTLEVHIHVVGQDRPSLTNDLLVLYM